MRPFKEVIACCRRIPPLNPKECEEYIDHRLRMVGSSSSQIFTPGAMSRIGEFSGGIPRIINVLCDNALIAGSIVRPKIDERIIDKTVRDLGYLQTRSPAKPHDNSPPTFLPLIKERITDFRPSRIFRIFRGRSKYVASLIIIILVGLFFGWTALHFIDWRSKEIFLEKRKEPPSKPLAFKTISVKPGETISIVAKQHFHAVNPTLLDFIHEFNPQIADLNRISPGQQIRLPEITPHLLLNRNPDQTYRIRLGTFNDRRMIEVYKNIPVLRNKKFEIVSLAAPLGANWFRIMVGDYETEEEGLRTIQALIRQGKLPALAGFPQ